MADLPVGECVLAGPRFIASKPATIGIWAALQLALNLGMTLLMIAMMGPQLQALAKLSGAGAQSNPQATLAAVSGLLPGYLVLMLLSLVIYGVIYAAMNRAVLRPRDSAFVYLRLGGDEVRQGLLVVIYAVLFLMLYVVAILVGAVVIGILSVAQSPLLSGLGTLVVFLAVLGLFIFLGVRLSLSSALTFETGRLHVFGGWAISRGHFWSMVAVYLLCAVQVLLLAVIAGVIIWLALGALTPGGDAMSFFTKPDMGSVGAFMTPARLVYSVMAAAMTVVIFPITLMPGPAMYRALTTGRAVGELFA